MSKIVLLIYCTLLTVFINVSGLISAKRLQDYILQLIFLPITVFLIISLVKTVFIKQKNKSNDISPSGKPAIFIIILLLIFFFAYAAINTISIPESFISPLPALESTPTITTVPLPTKIIIPKTVIITSENQKTPINVREKPASASASLAKVKPGTVLSCFDFNNGWYQIKLKDNKFGWVFGEFISPYEKEQTK